MTENTLTQRLRADSIAALKAGEKTRLNTLRNVLGEIETREKSGKTPVVLGDAEVTKLLQKQAAGRRETAQVYTDSGNADRAAQEIAEAEVIEAYLPKMLTEDEAVSFVNTEIYLLAEQRGAALTTRDMGAVMKAVTSRIAGRYDGKAIAEMVKQRLV